MQRPHMLLSKTDALHTCNSNSKSTIASKIIDKFPHPTPTEQVGLYQHIKDSWGGDLQLGLLHAQEYIESNWT
jgi:hypothetical protein